jgi:acyl-CoA thioester hydrolase
VSDFSWHTRIYWEDTDGSGVVYHANYVRFFERARTEWLRAKGLSQQDLRARHGIVFTVSNIEVDYLRPARLDDELVTTVVLDQLRRVSLTFSQSLSLKAGDELARARVRIACVSESTFRPAALPDEFLKAVSKTRMTGVSV